MTEINAEHGELAAYLQTATCAYRFSGKGGGKSKLSGCCPVCGAHSGSYRFVGRWKRCSTCGFDKLEQGFLELCISDVKHGRSVEIDKLRDAVKYHCSVFAKTA